ncbi:MAG: hypothetical protein K5986_06750 [Clostridium sp.]|nr:hypothetical protein [Clostridium sp.]
MYKFLGGGKMVAIIDRYINMVRTSKLKTMLFSLCFALVCLVSTYLRRDKSNGLSDLDNFIVSIMSSVVLGIVWFISSLVMVKISDNIEERKSKANEALREAKREKAIVKSKKVNNKKKKKNRREN